MTERIERWDRWDTRLPSTKDQEKVTVLFHKSGAKTKSDFVRARLLSGLARLFGCSLPTANRIKQSGKIDRAITQVGRKIIVDADLALELAGRKSGGRR